MKKGVKTFTILTAVTIVFFHLFVFDFPDADYLNELRNSTEVSSDVILTALLTIVLGPFILLGFVILPFIIIYINLKTVGDHKQSVMLMVFSLLIILSVYLYTFWTVFWFNDRPDALDGTVLMVLPIPALIISTVCASISSWLFSRR